MISIWQYFVAILFGIGIEYLQLKAIQVLAILIVWNQVCLVLVAKLTSLAPKDTWLVPLTTSCLHWSDIWQGALGLPLLGSLAWIITTDKGLVPYAHSMPWFIFSIVPWILLCYAIFELVFYACHRLLHHSQFLYKYVHAKHHERPPCFGYSAYDMTMLDWFGQVAIPIMTPILLLNPPLSITATWIAGAMLQNCISHAGVEWAGILEAQQHHAHHYSHQRNFATGFLDNALGTACFLR